MEDDENLGSKRGYTSNWREMGALAQPVWKKRNRSRLKAQCFSIVGPSSVAKVAKTFGESEIPKLLASFATKNQPVNGFEEKAKNQEPRTKNH